MHQFEHYWLFATFCFVVACWLLRLILREHITLQGSLWLLSSLVILVVLAVVPDLTVSVARAMGFALPSNFFFALAIGALALLHVRTLVTLSRTELRSITLTQEIGLLREQLDRLSRTGPGQGQAPDEDSAARPEDGGGAFRASP